MSRVAVSAVLLGAAAAGCAGGSSAATSITTVTASPRSVAVGNLSVALSGRPTHSFIIPGGHWRVCDTGTVTNPTPAVAVDVRVVVSYLDHGVGVGGVAAADSAQAGGALGDIPPGQSRPFSVCGLATREPDSDQVSAVLGG